MSDDGPQATWFARLVVTVILGGCVACAWWFLVGRQIFTVPVPPGAAPHADGGRGH
jgi:hypothetical protein